MKTRFVSIKNAVLEFIQDSGFQHDEIDQATLIRWASDVVRAVTFDQQLFHRVTVLRVENGKAELPEDFEMLTQAASRVFHQGPCDCDLRPDDECCTPRGHSRERHYPPTRRPQVVQWVQAAFEDECEIEINLKCPRCHKTACDCESPAVEVDVDRIWELSHPEYYYQHFNKVRWMGEGRGYTSFYSPKFKLMRYAQDNLFNADFLIGECVNLMCEECPHSFMIQGNFLEVDFEKGEVLLSYLGKALDDDGDIMIPDHEAVFRAITHGLTHKYFHRKYLQGDDRARARSFDSLQLSQSAVRDAYEALNVPEFLEFQSWMENNWYRRLQKTKIRPGERSGDEYAAYRKWMNAGNGTPPRNIPSHLQNISERYTK